tara:strand:+ start:112 stop:495 length:384 start_codon:yes stop_codon:yes gene_type:complete
MPLYLFSHPKTGEMREVFFHMNDIKYYEDESGIEWNREYGSPQLNTNGTVDPWDSKSFVDKTGSNQGKIGDLLDRSADLSKERASQNGGVDPVKEKYYKDYSKKRNGALHEDKKPTTFENKHVKVDL